MSEIRQTNISSELEKKDFPGEPVPHFVSDLPKIDPKEASQVAKQYSLLPSWLLDRHRNSPQGLETFYAEKGLQLCRLYSTTPQGLSEILEKGENSPNALELFDRFREKDPHKTSELMAEEQQRRDTRDRDILQVELSLLRKRQIDVPEFSTLLEYCGWVPEATGHNDKIRKWAEEHPSWLSSLATPRDIYWDLHEHYSQMIRNAQKSFDPLYDWKKYFAGEFDLTSYKTWGLQNMGEEDISYYSMCDKWGGGTRTRPGRNEYDDILLTHSTSLPSAQRIVAGQYLEPRICYSSGQVVSVRNDPEVVFIFPKDALQQTYSLAPYTEPGGGHEREIRSNEINNINFAIACVPVSQSLFPDYHGSGQGTTAIGRGTIAKWSKQYLETGRLWTDDDEMKIRSITEKHFPKGNSYYD